MYSVMWSEHCSYKCSQDLPAPVRPEGHARDARRTSWSAWARTPASSTSARAGRSPSRSRATTTRATSSRSRAPRPASAASCATSSRWARARSRSWTRCASAPIDHPDTARVRARRRGGHLRSTATASACPTSAARPCSTRRTRATRSSTRSRSACCATRTSTWPTPAAPATRSCCSARAPAATASAARRILASDTFDDGGPTKRPAVQVGDPFAEKVLIECCLELFAARPRRGHPGPRRAPASPARRRELAVQRRRRHARRLDHVLLRDPTLTPEEILMSESQERMMAIVEPEQARRASSRSCAKWDVETSVLGEVTDTGRLVIDWHGETIVDVDPRTVARRRPGLRAARSPTRPGIDALQADDCRGALAAADDRRRAARARSCSWSAARTSPTSRGSPTSTTATCWATPRWRYPDDARHGPRRRGDRARLRARHRRATAATASSTRTPARSWPSPRPTATSPSPGASRSRSPTA